MIDEMRAECVELSITACEKFSANYEVGLMNCAWVGRFSPNGVMSLCIFVRLFERCCRRQCTIKLQWRSHQSIFAFYWGRFNLQIIRLYFVRIPHFVYCRKLDECISFHLCLYTRKLVTTFTTTTAKSKSKYSNPYGVLWRFISVVGIELLHCYFYVRVCESNNKVISLNDTNRV